jgi:hypothetical protein
MALTLTFTVPNELDISPATNGVYSVCGPTSCIGTLNTNTPAGETINSITINENTITVSDLLFDGLPVSFPYTVNFGIGVATSFGFTINISGTIGNTDSIEFVFNMQGGGTYSFQYDITELDIQNSITIDNNTLPLDFGTVEAGSSSSPISFVINNETFVRHDYGLSSDSEISFSIGSTSVFPRTTYTDTATWNPTSAYDLSSFSIFADMNCGQAAYPLAGISTEPPVSAASSKKLIIANSISI